MQSIPTHLRRLVALALPTTASQLGAMFLLVVDVVMLGRVGVEALAAASLGRVWVMGTVIVAMGLLFGIDPVAAQAHGAGDDRRLNASLGHGLGLALLATVPVGALWLVSGPVLRALGQEIGLVALARGYVLWQIPGLPFFLGFTVLKQYLQAQGLAQPPMWVTFAANGVNVVANWVLIFGHWGAPALGVVGAGMATSLTHAFLFVALAGWMAWVGRPRSGWKEVLIAAGSAAGRREIARFGGPVGIQLGLEMWAFQIATLMAGRLGQLSLAGHTVVMTLASITFMMPLGVSIAACVRVGNLIGAGEPREAQRASWVAFGLGAGLMSLAAVLFLLGRHRLPTLFSPDGQVIALGAALLPVAAAFQIFDGLQVVGTGILRGMGQTRPAVLFNFLGYYGLALPAAWWLAFHRGVGVAGLWWGLSIGLAAVAGLLLFYIGRYGPAHTVTPWRQESD